jgi:predicted enzyme related to lactoylglutathione lyase
MLCAIRRRAVRVLRTDAGPGRHAGRGRRLFLARFVREGPRRAASFYRGLAGYEVGERETDSGASRLVLESHGYARAGILPLPPRLAQSGWLPYVLVSDVAATLAKVATARGSVLVQPDPALLDGRLAVIADPVGGVLGIVDWERQ